MNKNALFLLIPIFVVFFVWGLQVGNNLEVNVPESATTQIHDIKKTIEPLPNGQKNILIFIVSQLELKSPKLIGVWLMSYMSSEPYVTVLAIFPSPLQKDTTIDNRKVDLFKLRQVDGISIIEAGFLDALKETNIWVNGYVLIDLEGLKEVLVASTSKDSPQNNLEGEDILNQISNLNELSDSSSTSQIQLLQQLCNKYTLINSIADLKQLRDLYPKHISGDLDPDVLLGDWQQFIKSRNGSFCIFPQKEMLLNTGN